MKDFGKIIMGTLMFVYGVLGINADSSKVNTNRDEPPIAVMYAHPELAEEYTRETVKAFAPDPETLKITYCKAQYIPLYRAYVVNCYFNTNDAYGDMQTYKIQVKVQILPDRNGGVKYNALDFKEIR